MTSLRQVRTVTYSLNLDALAKSEATYELGVESEVLYIALLPKGVDLVSSTLYIPSMKEVTELCKMLLKRQKLVIMKEDENIAHIDIQAFALENLLFYNKAAILKAATNQLIGFVITHLSDELTLKSFGVLSIPKVFIHRCSKSLYEKAVFEHGNSTSGSLVERLEEFLSRKSKPNDIVFRLTKKGITLGQGGKQEVSRSLYPVWDLCYHAVKECGQYMDLSVDRDSRDSGPGFSYPPDMHELHIILLTEGMKSGYLLPMFSNREDQTRFIETFSPWFPLEEISRLPLRFEA